MFKYFVTMETGYCGSTERDIYESPIELTDEEQCDIAWAMAVDNASSYGYELCDDYCEYDDCEMEHPDNTGIDGYMVPYVPEEHDMYL